jgi:phosphatidylinositol-3-phosphatase
MRKFLLGLSAVAALWAGPATANGTTNAAFFHLDHVFLIMMENHGYGDIIGNPNAPFVNAYTSTANLATNYWAVGHPSLTNYIEILGGSNFAVTDDFWPNWVHGGCVDNEPSSGCGGAVAPIAGTGVDVASPATVDPSNPQIGLPPGTPATPNNWALRTYNAASYTAQTIAHQLVHSGRSWKSYQEDLPTVTPGIDGINYSDGMYSNLSPASLWNTATVQKLYAVKHNPFVYFKDVQLGTNPALSLDRVVDFDGPHGLWADLATGNVPNLAFIAPNQCHDQHGAGGGSGFCTNDATATQWGDATLKKLVDGIKSSLAWKIGRNAIVIVWDENDFGNAPNQIVLLVDTNYGKHGRKSNVAYDHFSLTRTLDAGFGLPCLNHACDATSTVMYDMFGF